MSIIYRAIKDRFVPKKIEEAAPKIMELTTITEEQLEKIRERGLPGIKEAYRKVYENDGLTYQLVNYLADKIVGQGYYFEGEKDLVEKATKWSEQIGLQFLLKMVVKDAIIYGTGWIEMVPSKKLDTIEYIKVFNPANIDFIRDSEGKIVMEGNRPQGFEITEDSKTIKWFKDRIEQGNITLYRAKNEDLRDRIAWFVLERYGDSLSGISFIKPIYRSAIIRSNIADLVGESAFRGGGIVAYHQGPAPQEKIDKMAEELKNITSKNIFVLTDKWKLDTVPTPDIKERIAQIIYLADEEAGSFGIPLDVLLTTVKSYASDLPSKLADLEQRIASYQKYVAYQFNTQVIRYLLKLWKRPEGDLRLVFSAVTTATRLQNSRIRATLARRGLIKWDPELELKLRREEGLPTTFVQAALDKWFKEKKTVESEPEETVEKEVEIDTSGE
ncbi:MAG: hypothetical protein QXK24_00160 [Ignisphaera sp.]